MRPGDLTGLDPQRVAVLVDYDGTLAPVVERPEDALPHPDALPTLEALVDVVGLVAVVSGRPVAFLRDHVVVPGVVLVGQYGLERREGSEIVLDPRVGPYLDAIAAARLEAETRWPELFVERKGDVAFSVHWRTRPDRAVRDEVRALASRHGLGAHDGRMACEVRPPIDVDKGAATATLIEGYEGALFAGDDRGDLSAFAALAGVEVPVRVGVRSDEAPPELESAVDLMVDGPDGAIALLNELAEGFSRPR